MPTSLGPSRLVVDEAAEPRAALWLGHGAGGGVDSPDLAALAARLPARGVTVLRYEQPWRTAGRRIAPRPATLDVAWLEAAPAVAGLVPDLPLVIGGRSAGARVACRTASNVDTAGVVCLSFPLHPPGRPEKSRLDELLFPGVPVLVLQGDRDTFGTAADLASDIMVASAAATGGVARAEAAIERGIRVMEVTGADHSLEVLASSTLTARDVAALIADAVADFVRDVTRAR